jgi:hypothetical protein
MQFTAATASSVNAVISVFGPDTIPPSAPGAPSVSLRDGGQISGSRVPVTMSWTPARDTGSGLASRPYTVERSTDGGAAWTVVGTASGASFATTIAVGQATRFRVTAVDRAGNGRRGAPGATRTAKLVQQTSRTISWRSTWTTVRSGSWSGGSAKYARSSKATASYTFRGYGIAVVSAFAPSRGKAKVCAGGSCTTVDLRRSSSRRQVLVASHSWSTIATRTIKVRVLGTSGRPRVDVDAVVILRG